MSKKLRMEKAMLNVPEAHDNGMGGSSMLQSGHTKREPFGSLFVCQTASGMRSHVTVSGRPQKQKAQILVLENLLEIERAIALFRLSLHTHRLCNGRAKPYTTRLAAIRGKLENLPRFFASERFSDFYCTMLFHICQTSPRSKIAGRR